MEGSIENKSCSSIRVDQNGVWTFNTKIDLNTQTPKIANWGPPKPKMTLNENKIKVSIEESIENTSGLALWVDAKTVSLLKHQKYPIGGQKSQKQPEN